jgi:hypothetical protein
MILISSGQWIDKRADCGNLMNTVDHGAGLAIHGVGGVAEVHRWNMYIRFLHVFRVAYLTAVQGKPY